jgi:hypothetical protein
MKLHPRRNNYRRLIGDKVITRLAGFSLLSFCLLQLPTPVIPTGVSIASSCECLVFFLGGIPAVGFVPGEILRITVSDPEPGDPAEPRSEPARAQVKLFDHQGNQIAQSTEFSIPRNGFHSVEFRRESIPLSGEPSTGRLQVHPTIVLQRLANPQLPPSAPPVRTGGSNSLELVDSDGRTKIWIDMGFPVRARP